MSLTRDDFSLPPAWRPNPGDIVEGVVDRIEPIFGGGFEPYYAVVLKFDGERALRVSVGGEIEVRRVSAVALHAFHTVLRNELARVDAQVGDRLGVLFEGSVEGGRGNACNKWGVRKQGGVSPTVRWDHVPGEPLSAIPTDLPADTRGLMAPLPHEQREAVDAEIVEERAAGSSPHDDDDDIPPFRRLPTPNLDVTAPTRSVARRR